MKELSGKEIQQSLAQEIIAAHLPKSGTLEISTVNAGVSFDEEFEAASKRIKERTSKTHDLFTYLQKQSELGFTPVQYQIFRDNFTHRTISTIPTVAATIAAAALSGDEQTVVETLQNLQEECGFGSQKLMHSRLLSDSHDNLGEVVYNLKPLGSLKASFISNLLVPAVTTYHNSKLKTFNQSSYAVLAGNGFAHETSADNMLDNFRKALFEPVKGYYTEDDYNKKIMPFFKAHKDDSVKGGNIEENHGIMAEAAAKRSCLGKIDNIENMERGAVEFFNCQDNLFNEMKDAIEKAGKIGVIVPPKSNFKDVEIPGSSPGSKNISQLASEPNAKVPAGNSKL
ncbi:MAG: hypothetical protein ACJAW3_000693 [Lentimonas sp.]|jgi:hypothetical protein